MADVEAQIAEWAVPTLEAMGFELVLLKLRGGSGRPVLQVLLDKAGAAGTVTLDDCADASRALSALLEVHDPIVQAYQLEVGSAGIDRPLTRPQHFKQYLGEEVKVQSHALAGRSRYRGVLVYADDRQFSVEDSGVCWLIPYEYFSEARLVLTDALMQRFRPAQEPRPNPWEGKRQSRKDKPTSTTSKPKVSNNHG